MKQTNFDWMTKEVLGKSSNQFVKVERCLQLSTEKVRCLDRVSVCKVRAMIHLHRDTEGTME